MATITGKTFEDSSTISIVNPVRSTGLLTTISSLPLKYRSCYLSIPKKSETPLDLSVKTASIPIQSEIVNDVPIATMFTEVYTEPSESPQPQTDNNSNFYIVEDKSGIKHQATTTTFITQHKAPITPPATPTKRKLSEKYSTLDDEDAGTNNKDAKSNAERFIINNDDSNSNFNPVKIQKINENSTTPAKPIKSTADKAPKTAKSHSHAANTNKSSKNKATRKLKFDEETSSPVSGTIIRPLEDITDGSVQYSNGDIDPKYNIVEMTNETKAELAAIKNIIGDYICKLCLLKFEDVFGLAQHRCACIVILEYRCPECGKQFNCAANLASHRRWHKAKKETVGSINSTAAKKENQHTTIAPVNNVRRTTEVSSSSSSVAAASSQSTTTTTYACKECGKLFKRQAYLRKHQLTHTSGGGGGGGVNDDAPKTTVHTKTSQVVAAAATAAIEMKPAVVRNDESYTVVERATLSSNASVSSSSSSTYILNGGDNNYRNVVYEYEIDSMSNCSDSSNSCGYLQIVESGLTEEENIAAAALTNLRNCASVIQHTTMSH